jgi:hypothetical protein
LNDHEKKIVTGSINGNSFLVQTYLIDPSKPKMEIVGHEYVFNTHLASQDYFSKHDINDMIRLHHKRERDE